MATAEQNIALQEFEKYLAELRAKRASLGQRIAALHAEVQQLVDCIAATEKAVACYRAAYRLPAWTVAVDEALTQRLRQAKPRDMAIEFAKLNGGRIVIRDAARALASIGVFANEKNASSNLFTAVGRATDRFCKVKRGEYALLRTDDAFALEKGSSDASCPGSPGE